MAKATIQTSPNETIETTTGVESKFSHVVKSGTIQLLITIVGVAVTVLNLWIASKLSPLATDISTVATAVKAQNERLVTLETTSGLYLPRYIATEQQVASINKSLDRIEAAQLRLENKIDTISERR